MWHCDQAVRINPPPLGKLLARHSETAITEALYTGTQTLPFGPRMRAMPAGVLWEI